MQTLLTLLFVFVAGLVSAQDRPAAARPSVMTATAEHHARLTHAAIGAHVVAQFADISTTQYALGTQRYREANPVLRQFGTGPVRMALVKGSYAVGTSYLLLKLHRTRPKLAFTLAVVSAVTTSYVAARNARLTKER